MNTPEPTNALQPVGQTIFNSVSTIQTATHIAMIVTVITGSPLRQRYRMERAEKKSLNDGESGNRLKR